MFEIVPIKESDYESWLELWSGYLEFYEAHLAEEVTAKTFERILSADIHGALAKNTSGEIVGLVHWITHRSTWSIEEICYLEDLFVAQSQRGKGVGKTLIEHVFRWSMDRNLKKVYWLTAESNHTARRLYDDVAKRTGFIHYEKQSD
ncbi:MAG: GNAT family N-acetyltransferase [Microbacteriaceae bacterium]|nr:GNAT family N-acetyltransferase [Microbacteriaceae bacterium]